MSFKLPEDIIPCYEEDKAKKFVEDLWGCAPTFICTIGNTETAKIPGISAAGAGPASMDYTPAADVELLFFGKCKCIDSVPVTPDGVPTPGRITMSAMKAANIPFFVLNGGVKVRPHAPYFDVEGQPGEDIRTGRAVKNAERSYDRAVLAGKNLAKLSDYLVVGESISGGTTTAMAVLTAMGVDAAGRLLNGQVGERGSLRQKIVEEGIRASGLSRETLKRDPMAAVEAVGDPMIAAAAGLIAGAADSVPVIMAGGVQMAAVLSVVNGMDPSVVDNLAIGTTKWVYKDQTSDIKLLVSNIAKVPVIAANLNFINSRYEGLRAYEAGVVKEGVGAGGSTIAAIMKTQGKVNCMSLMEEIEKNYARLVSRR